MDYALERWLKSMADRLGEGGDRIREVQQELHHAAHELAQQRYREAHDLARWQQLVTGNSNRF